jgi:hypothetical protein
MGSSSRGANMTALSSRLVTVDGGGGRPLKARPTCANLHALSTVVTIILQCLVSWAWCHRPPQLRKHGRPHQRRGCLTACRTGSWWR